MALLLAGPCLFMEFWTRSFLAVPPHRFNTRSTDSHHTTTAGFRLASTFLILLVSPLHPEGVASASSLSGHIDIVPNYRVACPGKIPIRVLTCVAHSEGLNAQQRSKARITYQWYRGSEPSAILSHNRQLVLNITSVDDTDDYICAVQQTVQVKPGSLQIARATFSMNILVAGNLSQFNCYLSPYFVDMDPPSTCPTKLFISHVAVPEGGRFVINCSAASRHTNKIWYRLVDNKGVTHLHAMEANIDRLGRDNAGNWTCKIDNDHGRLVRVVSLRVIATGISTTDSPTRGTDGGTTDSSGSSGSVQDTMREESTIMKQTEGNTTVTVFSYSNSVATSSQEVIPAHSAPQQTNSINLILTAVPACLCGGMIILVGVIIIREWQKWRAAKSDRWQYDETLRGIELVIPHGGDGFGRTRSVNGRQLDLPSYAESPRQGRLRGEKAEWATGLKNPDMVPGNGVVGKGNDDISGVEIPRETSI